MSLIWPCTTWELAFIFEPRDLWVGVFVDEPRRYDADTWYWVDPRTHPYERAQSGNLTTIYFLPLPMMGLRLRIRWKDRPYPNDPLE